MIRTMFRVPVVAAVLLALAMEARAEYYYGDFEEAPVERLIQNLSRDLEREPENAHAHYLLARVHSMAFASAPDSLRVDPETGEPQLDDGASHVFIPSLVDASGGNKDMQDDEERREHLEKAIAHYRRALDLDPEHFPSQIGLGWTLMKAERREEALQVIRPAFERAWNEEKNASGIEVGRSLTLELGGYLLQLLTLPDDGREIHRARRRTRVIEAKPRWVTPILIPLGNRTDIASLTTAAPVVEFDLDGTEARCRWQWITPAAGWLVHDPLGRGDIRSGRQLLGGVAFWIFWNDGYEAMRALDDNADGELRGEELRGLAIWRDANENGISEPGEVRPLEDWGIAALACEGETVSNTLSVSRGGVRFEDGTVRPSYDWTPRGVPLTGSD